MADRTASSGIGLTLGGGIVIAGILIAIFWSVIVGVIVALVGLPVVEAGEVPKEEDVALALGRATRPPP